MSVSRPLTEHETYVMSELMRCHAFPKELVLLIIEYARRRPLLFCFGGGRGNSAGDYGRTDSVIFDDQFIPARTVATASTTPVASSSADAKCAPATLSASAPTSASASAGARVIRSGRPRWWTERHELRVTGWMRRVLAVHYQPPLSAQRYTAAAAGVGTDVKFVPAKSSEPAQSAPTPAVTWSVVIADHAPKAVPVVRPRSVAPSAGAGMLYVIGCGRYGIMLLAQRFDPEAPGVVDRPLPLRWPKRDPRNNRWPATVHVDPKDYKRRTSGVVKSTHCYWDWYTTFSSVGNANLSSVAVLHDRVFALSSRAAYGQCLNLTHPPSDDQLSDTRYSKSYNARNPLPPMLTELIPRVLQVAGMKGQTKPDGLWAWFDARYGRYNPVMLPIPEWGAILIAGAVKTGPPGFSDPPFYELMIPASVGQSTTGYEWVRLPPPAVPVPGARLHHSSGVWWAERREAVLICANRCERLQFLAPADSDMKSYPAGDARRYIPAGAKWTPLPPCKLCDAGQLAIVDNQLWCIGGFKLPPVDRRDRRTDSRHSAMERWDEPTHEWVACEKMMPLPRAEFVAIAI